MNTALLCKRGLDKQLLFVQTSAFVHLRFSFTRDVDRNLTGKVMSGFETCLLGVVHGQGLHSVPTITVLTPTGNFKDPFVSCYNMCESKNT